MDNVLPLPNEKVTRKNSGGKAMSVNDLSKINVNVPNAVVITTEAYQKHLDSLEFENLDEYLNSGDIEQKSSRLREKILNKEVSECVSEDIVESYDNMFSEESRVAVRSSATSEDMKDSSSAGQQDTYLNVNKENLVQKVKECWSSLFTERACLYRENNGISHEESEMAVLVQQMVDAELSGVMFTNNPLNGDDDLVIESAWGLGEGVVSGEVTPDRYIIDRKTGNTEVKNLSSKCKMFEWDGCETVVSEVPESKRDIGTLDEEKIQILWERANDILEYYGEPQDIEWAIYENDLYILQSRPITSIKEDMTENSEQSNGNEILVEGLGASPGEQSGKVRLVNQIDETDRVSSGDVLVTEVTTPDMVPAMQRAEAVVTDKGGMTSHAAIVSRELGVPAVVGTTRATDILDSGDVVTVDADKGVVRSSGRSSTNKSGSEIEDLKPNTPVSPMTATEVKVNVSLPQAAERAAATGADGVGLLRLEHLILSLGQTPNNYIEENGENEFIEELVEGIQKVSEEFYARPVRIRTLDAPTDEFRELEGGESEPTEDNPMLGHRGIRRSLDSDTVFRCQLRAYKRLRDMGYDNVEIMYPLISDADDVDNIIEHMESVGISPNDTRWGVMIETPSSAIQIDDITDRNLDFVSFGTNDLTQYTLAVDRNNERVSDRFDETHDSVVTLIKNVIKVCRDKNVDSSICGEAASKSEMIKELVESGVTSVSVNIDAVRDVQHEIKRKEQRIVLDDVIDD